MAGYGKQIVLFMILLNITFFFFGLTNFEQSGKALSAFGMNMNISNESKGKINIANEGNISSTSNVDFIATLGMGLIIVGSITIGLMSGLLDIGGLMRIGMVVFLTGIVLMPSSVIMDLSFMPFGAKVLIIGIFIIMYFLSVADFMGGVDF